MGQIIGTARTKHLGLEMNDKPTFPPDAGFKGKRPQRDGIKATPEQLSSAKIPLKFRDYCADFLLEYQVCRYKYMPLLYNCHHQKHAYLTCEQQDYIIRMKEFERERRLRERELRINPQKPPQEDKPKDVKPKEAPPKECLEKPPK